MHKVYTVMFFVEEDSMSWVQIMNEAIEFLANEYGKGISSLTSCA